MSEESIRLLLIEDKKHDFALSNRTLERSQLNCEITWVQRGAEALSLLQAQNFDVVTLDFNLPDMNGLEVFEAILDKQIDVPVIFVTGSGNEPVAVQAMKRGAQDYLVKDAEGHYLELLPAVIEKVLYEWQNRRATEAAAAAEKALLLEKERMLILSDFITNASHEFRTPLSVMKTALYLLGRHSNNEKQQQHIQRIEAQISNLSALVDDLVTMARIDRSSDFQSSTVYINDVLRQSSEAFQSAITEAQHTFLLDLDASLPSCNGNANELMLAFKKLLDNALRFTAAQGHISVRTSANTDNIHIEIQDSGIGMDEETRDHAFERFYRADKAHSTRGFGLGLPIALAIVEKHRGRIELETELHKGTVLRVLLPRN